MNIILFITAVIIILINMIVNIKKDSVELEMKRYTNKELSNREAFEKYVELTYKVKKFLNFLGFRQIVKEWERLDQWYRDYEK